MPDKEEKKAKAHKTVIKYMGQSDERSINAKDTFGGRLPGGFGYDAVWNKDNNHTVEFEDLDPEVLDLLLNTQQERDGTGDFIAAFKDVTGMPVIPDGEWAKRWRPRGLPDARQPSAMMGDLEASASTSAGAYGAPTGGTPSGSTTTG